MSLVAYGSCSSDESEEEVQVSQPRPAYSTKSESSTVDSSVASTSKFCISKDIIGKDNGGDIRLSSSTLQFVLPKPKHNSIHESNDESSSEENQINKSLGVGLFSSLPLPKSSKHLDLGLGLFEFEAKEKSVLPPKKTVKITVPSLSQFKDKSDGEPEKKKVKPSSSGSGLFSLLPAPKHVTVKETKRSLVPNVLTKKPVVSSTALQPTPCASVNTQPQKSLLLTNYEDSDEETEEDTKKIDFFALHSDQNKDQNDATASSFTKYLEVTNIETPASQVSSDQPLSFVSGFQPSPWANNEPQVGPSWQSADEPSTSHECSEVADYISVVEDDIQLDDEALQRLCGRRAKAEQMEFINVNGAEIMPDPKEWLVKQLSQEQPKMRSHSHKKNDGPTTQQRRKHQITYLAFQAKENEMELKNQWSQNRVSRKQTQSKYGF